MNTETIVTPTSNDLVSKEDFQAFVRVQDSGDFNMMSPEARQQTSLSKSKWLDIIRNYDQYHNKYHCGCGNSSC
tara:strand:+ start:7564 stop:7785 length:222 start_codon:yes stop_codon:yes gene_type:complete